MFSRKHLKIRYGLYSQIRTTANNVLISINAHVATENRNFLADALFSQP